MVVTTFRGLRLLALAWLLSAAVVGASPGPEARDQHGNAHPWAAQEGAVTVVDFAASWCLPCRETLPRLEAFAAQNPEVRVLVISVDENVEDRDALVRDLGLSVPVLWDEAHRAAEHYRPQGMPATFVFDSKGREILSVVGSKEPDWQRLLRAVADAAR